MKNILSSIFAVALFYSASAQPGSRTQAVNSRQENVNDEPKAVASYEPVVKGQIATPVKNQQRTGTCWAYSTASLVESQAIRGNIAAFDLSEMFIVRNIYIEKAKNYILRQGKTQFSEGGLGHDFIRAVANYGVVPQSVYKGMNEAAGFTEYDHSSLVKDLQSYLKKIIEQPPVDPSWLSGYIKILDKTMGAAPSMFDYKGKTYTPQSFAREVLRFNANDYVNLTSFTHHPFNQFFVLEVPDNFSNGLYYNLPLNELLDVIKSTVNNGYTVMWDADVSNNGFQPAAGYAMYWQKGFHKDTTSLSPSVTELAWSDTARQRLFENLTTQDDHLMHITGIEKINGKTFFNVKNSWGEIGPFKGYLKASEAYVAMNTISIIVPRAALPKSIAEKIK